MTTQDDLVFQVGNKHAAASGEPPRIDGSTPNRYYGYFESELREQLVFEYDYSSNRGLLWMGDTGWDTPVAVIDGKTEEVSLDQREQCGLACVGKRRERAWESEAGATITKSARGQSH